MKSCERCGTALRFYRRVVGRRLCADCELEDQEERRQEAARKTLRVSAQADEYRAALQPLYQGPIATVRSFDKLRELAAGPDLTPEDVARIRGAAIRCLADGLLGDGRLALWEYDILVATGQTLGSLTHSGWDGASADLAIRLSIGNANDGRLAASAMPPEVAGKRGELLHHRIVAARLDEVRVKELVLNQNAISFEFREGLAYQHGRLTGTERDVSRGIQEVDRGTLFITSQRVVFVGNQASEELPLARLLGVQLVGDAVQIRISGRKRYPTFRVSPGWSHGLAATVNTATQLANGVTFPDSSREIPEMPSAEDALEELLRRGTAAGMPEWIARSERLRARLDLSTAESAANLEAVIKDFELHPDAAKEIYGRDASPPVSPPTATG